MALTSSGALYTWGTMEGGRLGVELDWDALGMDEPDGDFVPFPALVPIGIDGAEVLDASCGPKHSSALLKLPAPRSDKYKDKGLQCVVVWGESMSFSGPDEQDAAREEVYSLSKNGWKEDEASESEDEEVLPDTSENREAELEEERNFYAGVKERSGAHMDIDGSDSENDEEKPGDQATPAISPGPSGQVFWVNGIAELACGEEYNMALTQDMKLYSWGLASNGQLGYQVKGSTKTAQPQKVKWPTRLAVLHVACGDQVSFAVGRPKSEKGQEALKSTLSQSIEEGTSNLVRGASGRNLLL
eukprot:CAMPEP_0184314512 /NCGR_PEP_ID=MMETSP1049-20130417/74922_1 /TAXON_ID=77928 /ORGANISM="Proteomonas sulcata, Strain CCMP704" /LENGTH=300 /DNA_ID=CAMNT_0026632463 /DNA_START=35 /DNA_END=937 /DNA_ORIENTATION=+